MARRDPHEVLGVDAGATPTEIKAAWRRLARTHHPDLIGDDPAASRVATQQMAAINEAYAALTRDGGAKGARWRATGGSATEPPPGGAARGRGGPPRPRPTRPVTARVDTTESIRPRNQTLRAAAGVRAAAGAADGTTPRAHVYRGQPPVRTADDHREPPRASTPTGPLARSRLRNFRAPAGPPLAEALQWPLDFGKFHGHTLGQVAAFEPSYIDWLATTITRDRDLVAAARVIREELDRRGVVRRARAASTTPGSRSA